MDLQPPSYSQQKHTESAYALLKAASLPYESFSERSGEVVPCIYAGPEAQLTDIVNNDLIVDSGLRGYAEVTCEPQVALRMTSNIADPSNSDDSHGLFVYQYNTDAISVPFSSYLERSASRVRSVQVSLNGAIPISVQTEVVGSVLVIRSGIPALMPLVLVQFDYSPAPGLWVSASGAPVLMESVFVQLNVTIPVTATAVRLTCSLQYPRPTQLAYNVSLLPDSGAYSFPEVWSTLRTVPFPYLRQLPPCQMMRRIAQDVLVTWTGSSLDNGGKIAIGLTPNQFCPILADSPYAAVAALRVNRYDGPIKFGCHGTWRPGALRDLDHMNLAAYAPATFKLALGYSFADATGSARIRSFGMFGFVSDNPIIGRMTWIPASTPAMLEALALYYQSYPACTNNKDHMILKSFKRAGSLGVRGLRSLLEQDDKIAALAMMAGQPEIAAAVKTAGKINRAIPKQPFAGNTASTNSTKQGKKKAN